MHSEQLLAHSQRIVANQFRSTLFQSSARKEDDSCSTKEETHVFPELYDMSSIDCLDFDAVKNDLYPRTRSSVGNVPCSVDAVVFEHLGSYLIEFKFNTADIDNIIRKIYDTVMLLIEHDGYTFDRARHELVYLVVSTGVEDRIGGRKRALGRSYSYCKEPWKKFRKFDDHWKLHALEDIVVKEAYGMHPATFNYFARLLHWKSHGLTAAPV